MKSTELSIVYTLEKSKYIIKTNILSIIYFQENLKEQNSTPFSQVS